MNDSRPRISVIMVVRNGEAYIVQALQSIFLSHQQPDEVLVIDGHSSDATVPLAQSVPGVCVITQKGTGIANAYNQAIAAATGDLLAFISHDDLWLPCKLDRQLALMNSSPDLMYSVTLVEHFVDAGGVPPPGFRSDLLKGPVQGYLMESLMVRPVAFSLIGMFNPEFTVGEDSDWFMRARDAGLESAVLPEVLVKKRVHADSATMTQKNLSSHLLTALRRSIERKRSRA